jgi:uncharacterized protein (DUF1800 family)
MVITHDAVIAANHFGLGARPGELLQINTDPRGWLKAQVEGARELPAAIASLTSSAQAFQQQVEVIRGKRAAKQAGDAADIINPKRRVILDLYLAQVAARYQVAIHSSESFRERLIHFWSNHFAVSADKIAVAALAGTLENEAIRPMLQRHFYDLLLAVETHPAMILYLDNQASMGPHSQLAQRAQRRGVSERKLDINENLAREILELHTLGVSGGYTQADVTTFAQVLSGWSIGGGQGRLNSGEPGKFVFREALHEPGAKTLLAKRYAEEGFNQGATVLKDLSRHPATAKFIATKLARHFIADDPPPKEIERIAKVFRDSDGHLPTVHRALIDSAQVWAQGVSTGGASKFKTPHEYVVSTLRAFDFVPEKPQQVLAPFELLGQRPYSPGSPAGWADIASQWDGSDALMKRIEWAMQVAQRMAVRSNPLALAETSLGDAIGEHTRMAIGTAADAVQGITLCLVSPEFLRR